MSNPIIVALDVKDAERALALVQQVSGVVGAFKIGSELFTSAGPDIVRRLRAQRRLNLSGVQSRRAADTGGFGFGGRQFTQEPQQPVLRVDHFALDLLYAFARPLVAQLFLCQPVIMPVQLLPDIEHLPR